MCGGGGDGVCLRWVGGRIAFIYERFALGKWLIMGVEILFLCPGHWVFYGLEALNPVVLDSDVAPGHVTTRP